MKTLLTSLFLISFVFLTSCEESTKPIVNPTIDYFPISVGNYWIYITYRYNSAGAVDHATLRTDSVVISRAIEIQGVNAFEFLVYSEGVIVDTMYFSKSGNSISRIYTNEISNIPELTETWFKIADFDLAEWHVYDSTLLDYPLVYKDSLYLTRMDYTVNSLRSADRNFVVQESEIPTKSFEIKYDSRLMFNYKATIDIDSSLPIITLRKINLLTKYYWFAQNVGLVSEEWKPSHSYWTSTPSKPVLHGQTQQYNGFRRDLLRFKINKK